jgi:ESCRT-I complex subunit VPS28
MRVSEMSPAMMSMDEEVRLYTTNAEREKYTLLGTLFGITVALDYLERAFVRDSITAAEYVLYQLQGFHSAVLLKRYSPACTRLIAQYKTMLKLVGDSVSSIEEFMARYRVSIPCLNS